MTSENLYENQNLRMIFIHNHEYFAALHVLKCFAVLSCFFILLSCSSRSIYSISEPQSEYGLFTYSADLYEKGKPQNQVSENFSDTDSVKDNTDFYIPSEVLLQIESVVCLESIIAENRIQFSGFIVDKGGLILSTAHDLKGFQKLNATLYDGRNSSGHVLKVDYYLDLALIEVNLESPSYISLEKGRNLLGIGEKIYSAGCPGNLTGTVISGLVSGPPRRVNDLVFWQVSMKVYPGSSGSPVFDSQGNLVAIVKGRSRDMDSLGFLIPFETIVDFVRGIK